MLIVISPAKRLDWQPRDLAATAPAFPEDAAKLARAGAKLSRPALQKLMALSPDLAQLTQERFRAYAPEPEPEATRPAALAFAGDTYTGLEAASLDPDEMDWAQDHLRILSGLYGLLRPRDAIQPYRLEMGSRLKVGRAASLYAYWGDRLATRLAQEAEALGTGTLVNCASQEYFGAVAPKALGGLSVVTPRFYEEKPGGPKQVSFFAKQARGAMARFVIQYRLQDPAALERFDTGGYRFRPDLSEPGSPTFSRPDTTTA
ncbi:peroxide stress protein YaaA [Oceanicola sp. 502str15]|uniref:peroxide stress protein YaaA n=1 Tax=Oceanicola sp. 502str15 TaxID=2696061 RepID=UPI002095EB3B|nr:peroxide stress protein YaaA [Oceanicola sp. 502str15]MCO6383851.1 peroxide stress protein YaaA [Oceanicola sp. 502str15]